MSSYASGKHAFGFCDRTGFRYKLKDLVPQIEAGRPNGMLVGKDVVDVDNPQWKLGMINMSDPQALRNPRPDGGFDQSRELSAFDPVGGGNTAMGSRTVGLDMSGHVGRVQVEITEPDSTVSVSGVVGTTNLGNVSVELGAVDVSVSVTGVSATSAVGSVSVVSETFAITVANPGVGNRYYVDGAQQATVTLKAGNIYRFDQSDSSNLNHPLRLSTTSNGTHSGGTEYTTGVVTNGVPGSAGAYTEITVASDAPTLYYYCQNHSNMGGTVNVYTGFAVTVATGTNSYGTGNKYYIGGAVSPTVSLVEGSTYRFDQSDSTNLNHPLRFSTTPNGTWGGGIEYTTGVTTTGVPGNAGAYTQITVAIGAPTLHYYCTNHSGMGGQANTP
tara:strand:- start:1727 stop:2884 length:1158 start_codon:yes stop_codon:yes gene_type:complete